MKVVDVNLTPTFRTCMAFRPALARSKGSIVNIASMNATLALPRIPAYCASNGGVVMLTGLRIEGSLEEIDKGPYFCRCRATARKYGPQVVGRQAPVR